MPGAKLADAQFALARDYGFDSWPKLSRHVDALSRPEVARQDALARDLDAVWHRRDEAAATRLNDRFHSRLDVDGIRHFVEDRLSQLPDGTERITRVEPRDTRLLVARMYGFAEWDDFLGSASAPFHRLDAARAVISPQQPMAADDWDALIAMIAERGLTGLEANNMMDDVALAKLAAAAPHLTVLKLNGSDRLTDEGLRHLAAFRDLEEVELGGWHSPMTDTGFAALAGLPRLRAVGAWWSRRITDAGVRRTLAACPSLQTASFLGTAAGDGLIADRSLDILSRMPTLEHVLFDHCQGITDAGVRALATLPALRKLALDGCRNVTRAGIAAVPRRVRVTYSSI
jgi:hypothetical protein